MAEDALSKWQLLRLVQIQSTQPELLREQIERAQSFVADQASEDFKLYNEITNALERFAHPQAIEGFRPWAIRDLLSSRTEMQKEVEAFAGGRGYQIANWQETDTPGIAEAASAALDKAADAAAGILTSAGKGLIHFGESLTEKPSELKATTGDKDPPPSGSEGSSD